jgi:protein-tyrosine phosphatase
MKTYLTSLRTRYGSTENYVNQQLSLDAEELQNTLRTSLLESAPTA